jgi:type IV secretory pathway VirJ component
MIRPTRWPAVAACLAVTLLPMGAVGAATPAQAAPPGAADSAANPAALANLPLLELPARQAGRRLAIVLSGDGGWSGIDKQIAADLNAHGVSVIGWDSLKYFWTARTPAGAANDLSRVMSHYAQAWQRPEVLLVGYSQGADTLPFMINRLDAGVHRLVQGTVLIAMSAEAFFEFHVSHWLRTPTGGLPTLPEVTSGQLGPVSCVYGADEDDTACRGLSGPNIRAVELAGGHHFDGDYAAVSAAIIREMHL